MRAPAVPDLEGGPTIPLDHDTFSSPVMKFSTTAGEIDVVLEPAGVGGFDELQARAVDFEVFGIRLGVAALDDIIASKEASGRPKDRAQLGVLQELAEELSRRGHERHGPPRRVTEGASRPWTSSPTRGVCLW